jgi:hypothetical protein
MAEKRRISVTIDAKESQKCDPVDTNRAKCPDNGMANGKPVSPLNGAVITPAAPGEVRNPHGHNQYNTLTKRGMDELLNGNKIDLTIDYTDAAGRKKSRRLHFEMQDGQPLHKGVAAVLLGRALSGDIKAAKELSKIVNDRVSEGDPSRMPGEVKITIVNAVKVSDTQ